MYGYIPVVGAIQPGATFTQGTDIGLACYITIDDLPLSLENYSLTFLLKKDETAQNIMFRYMVMEKTDGIEGYYTVVIPKAVSALLRQGTYYFSFVGVKHHTLETQVVYKGTLNIEIGVASPNPAITVAGVEVTADGESTWAGSTSPSTETTGPHSPDITFPT